MKLRNQDEPPPETGFSFLLESPGGDVIRVGGAVGIRQLTDRVRSVMRNNGMEIPEDLPAIIEHQICLRRSDPLSICWSGGIGDDIHQKWVKPFLKKASGLGGIVGKIAEAISGCTGCGGTTVYKSGSNNLGRAGTANRAGKSVAKAIGKMKVPK